MLFAEIANTTGIWVIVGIGVLVLIGTLLWKKSADPVADQTPSHDEDHAVPDRVISRSSIDSTKKAKPASDRKVEQERYIDDDTPGYAVSLGDSVVDLVTRHTPTSNSDPAPFGSHFDASEPADIRHSAPVFSSDYKTPTITPSHSHHDVRTPEIKPESHSHHDSTSSHSYHDSTSSHHDSSDYSSNYSSSSDTSDSGGGGDW